MLMWADGAAAPLVPVLRTLTNGPEPGAVSRCPTFGGLRFFGERVDDELAWALGGAVFFCRGLNMSSVIKMLAQNNAGAAV